MNSETSITPRKVGRKCSNGDRPMTNTERTQKKRRLDKERREELERQRQDELERRRLQNQTNQQQETIYRLSGYLGEGLLGTLSKVPDANPQQISPRRSSPRRSSPPRSSPRRSSPHQRSQFLSPCPSSPGLFSSQHSSPPPTTEHSSHRFSSPHYSGHRRSTPSRSTPSQFGSKLLSSSKKPSVDPTASWIEGNVPRNRNEQAM